MLAKIFEEINSPIVLVAVAEEKDGELAVAVVLTSRDW